MNSEAKRYFKYKENELDGVIKYLIDVKENYTLVLNSTNHYLDTNRFMAIDSTSKSYLCTIENKDKSFDNQIFSVSFKYWTFHPIGFSLRSDPNNIGVMQKFSFYVSNNYRNWKQLYSQLKNL